MSPAPLQAGGPLCGCTLEARLQSANGVDTWSGQNQGQKCILKVFAEPLDAAGRRAIQRGYRRAHGVKIPGVVVPSSLHSTPYGLVMVRPWVDGTLLLDELAGIRGPDQVQRAINLGERLFRTLAELHRDGLVHGQLSPGNIWVHSDGSIQLTDMGSSQALLRTAIVDLPGRLPPTAPEIAAGWGPRPATDIHAAGALLYAILAASNLEHTDRTTPWGLGASEGLPPIPLGRTDVPLRLSKLIEQTQALDWAARPTAAELAAYLASPDPWSIPAPLPSAPRREGQREATAVATEHLASSATRLLLLHGPAGSGRHRLADLLMRQELRSYRPPLLITANRAETGSLLIGTLRRLVGPEQHMARRRRLLRDYGPLLAALWPELALSDVQPAASATARDVIDAAVAVTQRSLADRPVFFVFDRLEDADPLSLRFAHSLVTTSSGLHSVAILDDRWQTDELRRMRLRLAELDEVAEVSLPDLSVDEGSEIWNQLTKGIPNPPRPTLRASASPARVTEQAHGHLATWLGAHHPKPDATATLFALCERVPAAVMHKLGMSPHEAVNNHIAVHGESGWLRRRHPGIEALGARGLARRDKLADRLADALEAEGAPAAQIASVRLLGAQSARTACVRAAIAAHEADHPHHTRRWLHVVERLPRDSDDPTYRALRAPLARVRAEVAHLSSRAHLRRDLLKQAVRRAQTPNETADLAFLFGLIARLDGSPQAAARHWRDGASSTTASLTQRVRCAWYLLRLALNAGRPNQASEAESLLISLSTVPTLPRGPRRWIAMGRAQAALAIGQPRVAADVLEAWLSSAEAGVDARARSFLSYAHTLAGHSTQAVPQVAQLLDEDAQNGEGLLLHGWLALLRGDSRSGARAHRRTSDLTDHPLLLPFEIAMAASRGEHHQLTQLLGRPAPSLRPDLYALWLTSALDALRSVSEPGLQRARLDAADADGPHALWPGLLLARAWHHIDEHAPSAAGVLATQALEQARAQAHPVHEIRARLMCAMLNGGKGWQELVELCVHHEDVRVRYDLGELSARLALQLGDMSTAELWIEYLSNAAVRTSDHGLAARATRIHRLVQASRS